MIDKVYYPYDDIRKAIMWFRKNYVLEMKNSRSWIVASNKDTKYHNDSLIDKVYSYSHFRIFSSNRDINEVYDLYKQFFEVDDDGVIFGIKNHIIPGIDIGLL